MRDINILKTNKKSIQTAVSALKKGKIIIYPTETFYGIGCDATNKKAVGKIKKIKKRKKADFISLVDSMKTAEKYGHLSKLDKKFIRKFMPGPLTLIVKRRKKYPAAANKDFAFRISSSKFAKKLCKELGRPLLSTSVNTSGKPPMRKPHLIFKRFKGRIDILIDHGILRKNKPSTVISLLNGKLDIIRKGKLPVNKIKKIFQEIKMKKDEKDIKK